MELKEEAARGEGAEVLEVGLGGVCRWCIWGENEGESAGKAEAEMLEGPEELNER